MKDSLRRHLQRLVERHEELARLLAEPDAAADAARFREQAREYARLEPLQAAHAGLTRLESEQATLAALSAGPDAELRALADEELPALHERLAAQEAEVLRLLAPGDPRDEASAFLEIRAGTGGDEAAIFAGDLLRMYTRYAESQRWQVELLSASEGEHGGYKEVITRISGPGVYGRLKFESGAHRVQRVPRTEAQGRIHTSAATVAVLPEIEDEAAIEIAPADLKVDTYRASGAGGQHVNKTESAIRITHLPTGLVVECQDERSQHKNRARALSLLKSRLTQAQQEQRNAEQAATRKSLVGSGDRSERIRTYNFPQGRVTDHRINLTLYHLESILAGGLEAVIEPLQSEYRAEQLAALGEGP